MKNKGLLYLIITFVFLSVVLVPSIGMATSHCPPGQFVVDGSPDCQLSNPAAGQLVSIDNFPDLAKLVINTLLGIAGAIAVIFLVIGGFQYVISRGNEEAMETAKKTIYSAIIGIVVIVMSYAIVVIINNVLTSDPDDPLKSSNSSVELKIA